MSAVKRSLDEIRVAAMAAMDANDTDALRVAVHELSERECEILSEKLGRHLDPGTREAEAELLLEAREHWTADDPRWAYLGNAARLIDTVAWIAAEGRGDEPDGAWFSYATGALLRLMPLLPEAFDLHANHQDAEAIKNALTELGRLTFSVHPDASEYTDRAQQWVDALDEGEDLEIIARELREIRARNLLEVIDCDAKIAIVDRMRSEASA